MLRAIGRARMPCRPPMMRMPGSIKCRPPRPAFVALQPMWTTRVSLRPTTCDFTTLLRYYIRGAQRRFVKNVVSRSHNDFGILLFLAALYLTLIHSSVAILLFFVAQFIVISCFYAIYAILYVAEIICSKD